MYLSKSCFGLGAFSVFTTAYSSVSNNAILFKWFVQFCVFLSASLYTDSIFTYFWTSLFSVRCSLTQPLHVLTTSSVDGFPWNFIWRILWNYFENIRFCLKSGKDVGNITWRLEALNRHKSATFEWSGIRQDSRGSTDIYAQAPQYCVILKISLSITTIYNIRPHSPKS
jgi:hypothetical protein